MFLKHAIYVKKFLCAASIVVWILVPHTHAQTTDIAIYQNGIIPPWSDVSWGSTRRTETALEIEAQAWGGASFLYGSWNTYASIMPTTSTELIFDIQTKQNAVPLHIQLANDADTFPYVSYNTVPASHAWQTIRIPIQTLNQSLKPFSRVTITSGTATSFSLNTIRITQASPQSTTSDPISSPPSTPPVSQSPNTQHPSPNTQPWISAYYAGWNQGQFNNGLPAKTIHYDAVTHIIHFALVPQADGTLDDQANSVHEKNARAAVEAAHAAGKKILISIGGVWTKPVFRSAVSDLHRQTFIQNIVRLIRERGYDGTDIDWEPLESDDAELYKIFIQELYDALGSITPRPLLTAANGQGGSAIFKELVNYFDQINLMTYDLAGAWPGWVVWHNAALYSKGHTFPCCNDRMLPSADTAVQEFISTGIPRKKLGIGIDFYGYVWTGGTVHNTRGIPIPIPTLKPLQSWIDPPSVRTNMPYKTLARTYDMSKKQWDADAHAAYLTQENTFVSFDEEQSIADKIAYVSTQGLGGVIVWELGGAYDPDASHPQKLLDVIGSAKHAIASSTDNAGQTENGSNINGNAKNPTTNSSGTGNSGKKIVQTETRDDTNEEKNHPQDSTNQTPLSKDVVENLYARLISIVKTYQRLGVIPTAFTKNLGIGMRGTDVTKLQRLLIQEHVGIAAQELAAIGTTGYFGNITYRALTEYQKHVNIMPHSGFFGPLTRAHANAVSFLKSIHL